MTPKGTYLPVTRCGDLIYVSNMDAERPGHGNFAGPVRSDSLEAAHQAAGRCAENIADVAQGLLDADERIAAVARLRCSIVTTECTDEMPQLGSAILERLCARLDVPFAAALTTYAPASLPGGSGIEAEAILTINRTARP